MLSADLSRKFQEVLALYLEAKEKGQPVEPDELLRQHPELADDLNEFFANEKKFASAAGALPEPPRARTQPASPFPQGEKGAIRRIGEYEILGEIARGGMGVVYRARHISLQRQVALKMMLAGAFAGKEGVRRFRAEAEAVADLDHPNIVPIYDSGAHQGQAYFCMKLIEGPSLKQQIASYVGKPEETARLIIAIARAVHHAHQRGILHRDLKPGNILLQLAESRSGKEKTKRSNKKDDYPISGIPQSAILNLQFAIPFVTDFGLAKRVQDDGKASQSTAVVGTAAYMAPEQATGGHALTVGADVYSLGAILFELLTGRPPFVGDNQMEVLLQLVDKEAPSPTEFQPRLDPDLAQICLKCLRKNPADRYASAEALAVEFEQWLQGEPLSVRAPTRSERLWRLVRRRPAFAFSCALAALILSVGIPLSIGGNWYLDDLNNQLSDANKQLSDTNKDLEAATEKANDNEKNAIAAAEREKLARLELEALTAKEKTAHHAKISALQESRRLLVEQFVASGQQHLLRDDLFGAAVWFGAALEHDSGDLAREAMHRIRLATTLRQCPSLAQMWFFDDKIRHLRLSASGHRLATVANTGALSLWDTKSGDQIGEPRSLEVTALEFSPDGQWLAALGGDGTVRLWTAATGLPHGTPLTHGPPIRSFVFSPDGKWIATSAADRLRIWETATTKPTLKFDKDVRSVSFRADGKKIIGISDGLKKKGTLHLWDLATGKDEPLPLPAKPANPNFRNAGFSSDGRRVYAATASNNIFLWHLPAKKDDPRVVQPEIVKGERALALAPPLDLYFQPGDTEIRVIELPANKIAYTLKHDAQVQLAQFSPAGGLVVTGSANRGIQLWRADSGQPFGPPLPHGQTVSSLSFSSDDQWLATADGAQVVRLWRLVGPDRDKIVTLPKAKGTLLSVSPDGKKALLAPAKALILWDIGKGRTSATLDNVASAQHVRWAPDGNSVGVASPTETRIFEIPSGKTLAAEAAADWALWTKSINEKRKSTAKLHVLDADGQRRAVWKSKGALEIEDLAGAKRQLVKLAVLPETFAFSPERRFGAAGFKDGSLRIFDLAEGKPATSFFWHGAPIHQLVYANDSRLLASVSAANRIRVWDAATGQPLSPAFYLSGPPAGMAFRADGAILHAWTTEGRLHYFNLEPTTEAPADLVRRIRVSAGQKFDAASGSLIPLDSGDLRSLWLTSHGP